MIPLFTTLAKTITGKIALGLAVATMGVGAAAAAGAEMPSLTNAEETTEESAEGTVEETTEETTEESAEGTVEETTDEATEEATEESVDASVEGTGESAPVGSDEALGAEPTHGAVVSTFTRETELTGCEKGQATAAVARGDVDPSSPTLTEDLSPYVAKCSKATEADEDDSDLVEASEAEAGWKDLRDENKATWHDAKDTFVAACGEVDGDDDDEAADDGGDEAELSPECAAMKAELKQLHTDGRAEWHDARDAEHAERKAERAEGKAERAGAAKGSEKGQGGKGKSGKD